MGFRWRGRLAFGLDESVLGFRRRVAIWVTGAFVGEFVGEGVDAAWRRVDRFGIEGPGIDTAGIGRAVVSGSRFEWVGLGGLEVDGAGGCESVARGSGVGLALGGEGSRVDGFTTVLGWRRRGLASPLMGVSLTVNQSGIEASLR